MSTLANIRPSILDLPMAEQEQIHRAIRESRHQTKAPRSKAIAKRREEKRSIFSMLDNLSPAEAAEILKKIGGSDEA